MMYNSYYFGGMHLLWWFIWGGLMVWIFFTPYDIPYQRRKKDSPLDILQKRFATGEITKEKYEESKEMLDREVFKEAI